MKMNPVSLEAESAVVPADAPRQGKSVLLGEPQEHGKCVSRPGSRGEVAAHLAAMREALACAGGVRGGARAHTITGRALSW